MEEKILEIVMTKENDNIIVNINNLAKSEDAKILAKQFFQMINSKLDYNNLEYAKMKTDKGEVILK